MTHYDNGSAFERRARDELRAAGYAVGRIRGSLGPADLIALPLFPMTGRPLLVQAKGGPQPRLDPDDWNELFALARDTGSIALLVTKPTRSSRLTWQQLAGAKSGRRGVAAPLAPFTLAGGDTSQKETLDG